MSRGTSSRGANTNPDGIPTRRLERWTNSGAKTQPSKAQQRIRQYLGMDRSPVSNRMSDLDIFIQGSHRNHTITYGGGDVDVVVKLESAHYPEFKQTVSDEERILYDRYHSPADYTDEDLRNDISRALDLADIDHINGRKAIQIEDEDQLGFSADIVPCAEYRYYERYEGLDESKQDYNSGIAFRTNKVVNNRVIENFPKQHHSQGAEKNERANGKYKETIRMFKNARNEAANKGLVEKGAAPSYFIECLLYNVPSDLFDQQVDHRYTAIVAWLIDSHDRWGRFVSQNGILPLFDENDPDLWTTSEADDFVSGLRILWDQWNTL